MQTALVVVRPFGGHAVGDVITDADEGAAVAAGEHADHVVRVPHEFAQAPAAGRTGRDAGKEG